MATPGTIPRERPSQYDLCPLRTAARHQLGYIQVAEALLPRQVRVG